MRKLIPMDVSWDLEPSRSWPVGRTIELIRGIERRWLFSSPQ